VSALALAYLLPLPTRGYETDFGVEARDVPHEARQTFHGIDTFVPPDEPAAFYLLTIRNDA